MHSHPDVERGGICASVSHFYHSYYCRLGGKTQTSLGSLMVNPRYDERESASEKDEDAEEQERVRLAATAALQRRDSGSSAAGRGDGAKTGEQPSGRALSLVMMDRALPWLAVGAAVVVSSALLAQRRK